MSFLARCIGLVMVVGGERCRGGRGGCSDWEEEGDEDGEGRLGFLRRDLSETAPPRPADFALAGMARAAAAS